MNVPGDRKLPESSTPKEKLDVMRHLQKRVQHLESILDSVIRRQEFYITVQAAQAENFTKIFNHLNEIDRELKIDRWKSKESTSYNS